MVHRSVAKPFPASSFKKCEKMPKSQQKYARVFERAGKKTKLKEWLLQLMGKTLSELRFSWRPAKVAACVEKRKWATLTQG